MGFLKCLHAITWYIDTSVTERQTIEKLCGFSSVTIQILNSQIAEIFA